MNRHKVCRVVAGVSASVLMLGLVPFVLVVAIVLLGFERPMTDFLEWSNRWWVTLTAVPCLLLSLVYWYHVGMAFCDRRHGVTDERI